MGGTIMENDNIWHSRFLGALVDPNIKRPFNNQYNAIQFKIKILSNEPYGFPQDIKEVTSFSNLLEDYLVLNGFTNEQDRIDELIESLENKYISFGVKRSGGEDEQNFYHAIDLKLFERKNTTEEKL